MRRYVLVRQRGLGVIELSDRTLGAGALLFGFLGGLVAGYVVWRR